MYFYLDQTEDGTSGLDVKVDHKGDHDFRVDVSGLQTDVTLASYSKVYLNFGHSELRHT